MGSGGKAGAQVCRPGIARLQMRFTAVRRSNSAARRTACAQYCTGLDWARLVFSDPGEGMPKFSPTGATAVRTLPLLLALSGCASDGAIVLRDMGSFHVGGRTVMVSGKPVTEIRRTPTGPLTKLDPNGTYQVEQTYVQYFLPA